MFEVPYIDDATSELMHLKMVESESAFAYMAAHEDLRTELVWREWRTVTQALALHYNKALFILEPNEISRGLVGKRV